MKNLTGFAVSLAALGLLSGLALLAQDPNVDESPTPGCGVACAAPGKLHADPAAELAELGPSCPIIGGGTTGSDSVSLGCSTEEACELEPAGDLAPDPLRDELVAHLRHLEAQAGDDEMRLDPSELKGALGFRPSTPLLMEAISIVWPEAEVKGGSSRCADFRACSLYGDLSNATGEQLEMYTDEKALDGVDFEPRPLPPFEARDFAGAKVTSADLRGTPTLLVPIAVHCRHSYQTLPILHDLAHRYRSKGLRIVGLLVNSGAPEDAVLSLKGSPECHDFWVTEGDSAGKLLATRLVPSHLLVNEEGEIERKLVGLKKTAALTAEIERLLGEAKE